MVGLIHCPPQPTVGKAMRAMNQGVLEIKGNRPLLQRHPQTLFDTRAAVIDQYKILQADEQPRPRIRQWLKQCLQDTTVTLPAYAVTDYQWVLNFLYS